MVANWRKKKQDFYFKLGIREEGCKLEDKKPSLAGSYNE